MSNGGLDVQDVSRRYGAVTAVSHVSFVVRPGEVLGYLGPNGSGKSTTVKMLAGLMPLSRGRILLDGVDIQDDLVAYKAQVGYVPDEAHVYTYLTGPEYVRLWGVDVAILHGLLSLVLGALLTQILLWKVEDMPCARRWEPESVNLGKRWVAYLTGFLVFTNVVPRVEQILFGHTRAAVVVAVLVTALAATIRYRSLRRRDADAPEPETAGAGELLGLN